MKKKKPQNNIKKAVDDEFAEFNSFDTSEDTTSDKIFNNAYKTGNVKFNEFPDISVDSKYVDNHLDDVYNTEKYEIMKTLMLKCDEIFKASQWNTLPAGKKIAKELLPFVFNEIFQKMDNNGVNASDIFITIAEYLDISHEKLYDAAGVKIQERLVFEMDQSHGAIKKKNIKRLF